MTPKLIVFGGLPGVGKTTLAQGVARAVGAAYLRIDVIEQALRDSGELAGEVGPVGYVVGYALAESQLRVGVSVVADSVNPLAVTRAAWRGAAVAAGANVLEIEVVCSDAAAHRRRVESRVADIAELKQPGWAQVLAREYEAWEGERLVIDTARLSPGEAVEKILARVEHV